MAREKLTTEVVDAPDVVPEPQPTLSPQTLAEQELGRKQAAINAAAMERAIKAREEEANK
jgi:hypothetical protein